MTAPSPLLAASTEQLAAAIAETVPAGAFDPHDIAAYLIESGAVVTVASLADDEALVGYVENFVPLGFREGRDPYANVSEAARAILRALAAALEDR